MKGGILFLFLCIFSRLTAAANSKQWESRSIYQVLTDRFAIDDQKRNEGCDKLDDYCGGTWRGISEKLDYIQGMGFDAVWISPIPSNVEKGYHGYWAKDLSQLNSHFGTGRDLLNLSDQLHKRGMFLMLDVVANHMGNDSLSTFFPFNKEEHFHKCEGCSSQCSIDNWNDQRQVEQCRLFGLPDLNQTVPFVSSYLNHWIENTVNQYHVDGLRIDTVPEVDKSFWSQFQEAANVFVVGEISNANVDYVSSYQMPKGPLTSVLSYPLFFTLRNVFARGKSMKQISKMNQMYLHKMGNINLLGSFIDNHDQPRFLFENSDVRLYKPAIVYNFFASGIPIFYYGSEQYFHGGNDPFCREPFWPSHYNTSSPLYSFVSQLNLIRRQFQLWKHLQTEQFVSHSIYSFSRGPLFILLSNSLLKQSQLISNHSFSNGDKLCDL